MSVQGGAPAGAQIDDAPPSKQKLSNILKFFNVLNALFLAITGVVSFLLISSPNFAQVLCACYIIFFSLLLLCFECHLGCMDVVIYRNFGFMFNWGGRLIFLFLNGVLAFTLSTMGVIAGCFTGFVILVNMFILCRYREFGEQYEADFAALRDKAAGKPYRNPNADDRALQAVVVASNQSHTGYNPPSSGGGAYSSSGMGGALVNAAVANPDAALQVAGGAMTLARDPHVQAAAASQNPFLESSGGGRNSELTEANGWKKFLDDKSGKYYFYSERTKETKWDTED